MITKEIMIDDWVINTEFGKNKMGQVEIVELTRVWLRNCNTYVPCEFIKPIPLTQEILEKNGFEVQDQGGGRKDVWTGFDIDCEEDIEIEFQYNVPVYLKIDGGYKGEYYTSSDIKYIHELQHAMRLCNIKKEIKLDD